MPKVSALARSARARAAVALVLVAGGLVFWSTQASASAALTVTPLTFNVVGLDSNNVNAGPNTFPIGGRVCNTGDAAATNVSTTLAWATSSTYISLTSPSLRASGTIAANSCADVYFEVQVARNAAAYDTARRFVLTATADGGVSASSPSPREIYVEHLVSQNRNSIDTITAPSTMYLGQTYTITMDGSTATQGYEQDESYITLDPSIFRVISAGLTYTSPAGATNDKPWADACGFDFDPTSPNYRSCVGPLTYTGGKAGGDEHMTYTVEIIGTGAVSLSGVIYDFSGSSYHYNSDYGAVATTFNVTAAPSADLSVTSSHTDPFTRGTNDSYTWTVANAGPSDAAGPLTVTSTLPGSLSFISGSGAGATCAGVAQVVTCTLADGLAQGASVPLTINVAVSPSALASFTPSVTVNSPTHDPDTANNTATDPTTTLAPPTTTTTSTTVAPTTTTSTTSTTVAPTTTTTVAPTTTTTSTTVAPTTTTTSTTIFIPLPTTTTTSTTVAPTTTTSTTSTTVAPTTTSTTSTTVAPTTTTTTSTTAPPTTTTSTTAHVTTTSTTSAPPDDAVGFVVQNGTGVDPIVKPTDSGATYSYISGDVPPGLSLLSDGSFGGTATENGTFEFVASVCQSDGVCTVRYVRVKVLGVSQPVPLTSAPLPHTGTNVLALSALGLLLIAAGLLALHFERRQPSFVRR
jgi:LPXTG-motif cell wall-anchored protein